MAYLEIRGTPHYYEWIAQDGTNAPTGKPVMVFLHGWGGSARYWRSTAAALSDRFDCLLYDLRGFGRSRLPAQHPDAQSPDYWLEAYAADLAELLDRLGLDRVYLNAHSMGASIAVLFLGMMGDRVQRAILTCSGIFEYDEAAFAAFYRFGGYVVKFRPRWLHQLPLVPQLFMARFLHGPIPETEQRAFVEDFTLADQAAALGTIFTSVSLQAVEEMPGAFAALNVPTLLISGEFDQIIPAKLGQQAAALSQAIDYCLIARTGHFPMLEDPDAYLAAVDRFLAIAP
ncbi:MAG: alpha/beta hydrolase [Oscillatoriales cyanobacterium]|nr:MAG: alpha/beta hydrolase [Oscillatoriales cyanobacterium]